MRIETIIKQLRRIMADNHRCFGCGYEHSCSTRGCAIMRNAADRLEEQEAERRWIPVTEQLPDRFQPVLVCREKESGKLIVEQGYKDLGDWWKVYGTRIKRIECWMPMPQSPKEGS